MPTEMLAGTTRSTIPPGHSAMRAKLNHRGPFPIIARRTFSKRIRLPKPPARLRRRFRRRHAGAVGQPLVDAVAVHLQGEVLAAGGDLELQEGGHARVGIVLDHPALRVEDSP